VEQKLLNGPLQHKNNIYIHQDTMIVLKRKQNLNCYLWHK